MSEIKEIPLNKSYTILSDGKVSKKRLLDALACLEADLKFLQEEIQKSDLVREESK